MEITKKLDVKTELLEENSKLIEAMELDIQHLINEQENIKVCILDIYMKLLNCTVYFTPVLLETCQMSWNWGLFVLPSLKLIHKTLTYQMNIGIIWFGC